MVNNLFSNLKDKSLDGVAALGVTLDSKRRLKALGEEQKKIYQELGIQCYQLFQKNELSIPQLTSLCDNLRQIEAQVQALETPDIAQAMKLCTCGARVPQDAKFCLQCGCSFADAFPQSAPQPISQPSMQRPINTVVMSPEQDSCKCACGAEIMENSLICIECGRKIRTESTAESQVTQGLVCICGANIRQGQILCMECGRKL